MTTNLKYPSWQTPLADAVLEFDPPRLREKLKCAEEAIISRIQELRLAAENSEHEVRSLFDGLSIIQGLRRDRLDSPRNQGGLHRPVT